MSYLINFLIWLFTQSMEREETILIRVYYFDLLSNIEAFICNFASEMCTSYFQSYRIQFSDRYLIRFIHLN